ncbi:universal stress protein [Streptomyces sp. RB6PN25]|uniref:Universal stress protein n=1 Tax=Streptomyces humicola TaxID=2953240 RepID=A0ABT1Q7M6_9ACTN|nr:universal stress protein [Streptomyces humicola]MCQ4084815.1 universal stress protein [Streptomyces humicola]
MPAVQFAFEEAAFRGAHLLALAAWQPPSFGGGRAEQAEQEWRRLLAEATAGWQEKYPDVHVRHELLRGHAVQILSETASYGLALVVGSRGRGGFPGPPLGSVSPWRHPPRYVPRHRRPPRARARPTVTLASLITRRSFGEAAMSALPRRRCRGVLPRPRAAAGQGGAPQMRMEPPRRTVKAEDGHDCPPAGAERRARQRLSRTRRRSGWRRRCNRRYPRCVRPAKPRPWPWPWWPTGSWRMRQRPHLATAAHWNAVSATCGITSAASTSS